MAKREYKEAFLELGFTCIYDRGVNKPQCVLCSEILSNESMKPNKLKRHFDAKHKNFSFEGKDRTFFERKEAHLKRQRLDAPSSSGFINSAKQATLASFHVAWHIARQKKPHNIAEKLIKPAAIDMARIMCGDESSKKLQKIPLSNDTIRLRINDMSFDIKNQLISAIKIAGLFSIQLDETTDVSKDAQLMVYVRYPGLTDIQEDILFCKPMSTTTRGEDIFLMVDSFFKEEGLNWNQCFSICTDGAAAMTASQKGFSTRAKQMNPQIISIHCLLHRQNLASKKLSPELCIVLDEIVAVVNFIKSRALNCRIFRELCFEFGAEYEHLLYYSEVRWLSRGKVVQRVLSLRTEVELFLREKKHPLASKFSELKWITQVAYLSDILFELNNLNTSMQGRNHTIIELTEKITCFKNKLKLWRNKVEVKKLASFPTLNLLVEDNNIDITDFEIQKIIINHLEKLIADFDRYFPADDVFKYNWVRMPFNFDVSDLHEEFVNINQFQEQLIEIQSDQALRYNFYKNTESLCAFWLKLKTEKPIIVKEALKVLLPFSTTYMCEAGFSALCVIKNNYRNKLNPEIDIRCSLTSIQPRFEDLSKCIQAQGSH